MNWGCASTTFVLLFLSRGWFEGHGVPGKLRAIQTASCLLQGPSEAGNRVLELSGIMESILALCASSQEADQLVAVEALIHAADKAKRATFITANGVALLKEIYKHSERDSIRIRALVVRGTNCSSFGRKEENPGPQHLLLFFFWSPAPCMYPWEKEGTGSSQ